MLHVKRSPLIDCDLSELPCRGCFFGGGGGGSTPQPTGTTTTVQKADPWSGQQPYLSDVFSQADWLDHNFTPQFYPGSTVAPLDPLQDQAINMEAARGLAGSPVASAAQQQIADTASGAFLPGGSSFDPYFKNFQDNVLSTVVPGITATFNQGNSLNNPGIARATSLGATDALNNLAGQLFEAERDNQIKAAALAPQLSALDFQNIAAVSDAGATRQNAAQQQLNDQIARWNYQQQLPYQQLNNYANLVQGGYGGTTTLTQPYFTNPLANGLSGALAGGLLGGALSPSLGIGSGYGTLGGAGLGSLLAFL